MTDDADVPPGEDFLAAEVAAEWADAAGKKRPWRTTLFDRFVSASAQLAPGARILELGSGPGFLAEQVLARCPSVALYTLLDFSEPMLALSRQRLGELAARATFVHASFKDDDWGSVAGGPFDAIFSLQAIHELRHKRHAMRLYEQARAALVPGGSMVICDHLPEGAHAPAYRVLYQSVEENRAALARAGFSDVRLVWQEHEMAMYSARA